MSHWQMETGLSIQFFPLRGYYETPSTLPLQFMWSMRKKENCSNIVTKAPWWEVQAGSLRIVAGSPLISWSSRGFESRSTFPCLFPAVLPHISRCMATYVDYALIIDIWRAHLQPLEKPRRSLSAFTSAVCMMSQLSDEFSLLIYAALSLPSLFHAFPIMNVYWTTNW